MWLIFNVIVFASILTFATSSYTSLMSLSGNRSIAGLKPLLSHNASISYNASTDPRWSQYHAPTPGAIVNVATERDVVATVSNLSRLVMHGSDPHIGEILQYK